MNALALRVMPGLFVLIWSTGFVVARYGMPHAPPMTFLFVRFVLSVAVFLPFALMTRAPWPKDRRAWGHLCVSGVLMNVGYLGGVWAAIKLGAAAGTVALIVGIQPLLTAFWLSARGGQVRRQQWLGLLLGFGGLMLVVWPKVGIGELGVVNLSLAVAALLAITAATLYQKRFVVGADVRSSQVVQFLAASVVAAPLAWLEPSSIVWNAESIGAMAWSVLVLTFAGNSLLFMLVQRGEALKVATLIYLVPPCTAALGFLLFRETLSLPMVLGFALVLLSVWLTHRG